MFADALDGAPEEPGCGQRCLNRGPQALVQDSGGTGMDRGKLNRIHQLDWFFTTHLMRQLMQLQLNIAAIGLGMLAMVRNR